MPNAHHASLDTGFNVSESSCVAPANVLPYSSDAVRKHRHQRRPVAFSHDQLLVTLVTAAGDVAALKGPGCDDEGMDGEGALGGEGADDGVRRRSSTSGDGFGGRGGGGEGSPLEAAGSGGSNSGSGSRASSGGGDDGGSDATGSDDDETSDGSSSSSESDGSSVSSGSSEDTEVEDLESVRQQRENGGGKSHGEEDEDDDDDGFFGLEGDEEEDWEWLGWRSCPASAVATTRNGGAANGAQNGVCLPMLAVCGGRDGTVAGVAAACGCDAPARCNGSCGCGGQRAAVIKQQLMECDGNGALNAAGKGVEGGSGPKHKQDRRARPRDVLKKAVLLAVGELVLRVEEEQRRLAAAVRFGVQQVRAWAGCA